VLGESSAAANHISAAKSGLFELFIRSNNFQGQLEMLAAQREALDSTKIMSLCMNEARAALAHYGLGNLSATIGALRSLLRRADAAFHPIPGDDPAPSVPTPRGPLMPAEEEAQLKRLHVSVLRALVDMEEARILDASQELFSMRLWEHGTTTLQAQRLWIMHLLAEKPANGATNLIIAAWMEKHVQFAADRVKALLGVPFDSTLDMMEPSASIADQACNSHGSTVYTAYRLASAKLQDVVIFALNALLPGFSSSSGSQDSAWLITKANWGLLPAEIRAHTQHICELGIAYAWQSLNNSTARRIVDTLHAVAPGPSVVGVVAQAMLEVSEQSPCIATVSKQSTKLETQHYTHLLLLNLQSVESQFATLPQDAPYRCLWLASCFSALRLCYSRVAEGTEARFQNAANAFTTLKKCVSVVSSLSTTKAHFPSVNPAAFMSQTTLTSGLSERVASLQLDIPKGPPCIISLEPRVTVRGVPECLVQKSSLFSIFTNVQSMESLSLCNPMLPAHRQVDLAIEASCLPVSILLDERSNVFMHLCRVRMHLAAAQISVDRASSFLSLRFDSAMSYLVLPKHFSHVQTSVMHLTEAHNGLQLVKQTQAHEISLLLQSNVVGLQLRAANIGAQQLLVTGDASQGVELLRPALNEAAADRKSESSVCKEHADNVCHFATHAHASCAISCTHAQRHSFLSTFALDDAEYSSAAMAFVRCCWFSDDLQHRNQTPNMYENLVHVLARDPSNAEGYALLGAFMASNDASAPLKEYLDIDLKAQASIELPELLARLRPEAVRAVAPTFPTTGSRNRDRAVVCWNKALVLQPDHPFALVGMVDHLLSRFPDDISKSAEAFELLDVAVTLSPELRWAFVRMGAIAFSHAVRALQQASAHNLAAEALSTPTFADVVSAAARTEPFTPVARTWSGGSTGTDESPNNTAVEEHKKKARNNIERAEIDLNMAVSSYQKALSTFKGCLAPADVFRDTEFVEAAEAASRSYEFPSAVHTAARCWQGLSLVHRFQGRAASSAKTARSALETLCLLPELRTSPASVLSCYAEALQSLTEHDEAVTVFLACLEWRPADPAALYAYGCSCRSLARRYIGDGLLGDGRRYVLAGVAAACKAIELVLHTSAGGRQPESTAEPGPFGTAARLYRICWHHARSSAPSPLWKLLADLLTVVYDAESNAYGFWAMSCSPKSRLNACTVEEACFVAKVAPSSLTDTRTPVAAWIERCLGFPSLDLLAEMAQSMCLVDGQLDEWDLMRCLAAQFATLAYAVAADSSMTLAAHQLDLVTPTTLTADPTKLSSRPVAELVSLLCDLGRALFLQAQSIVYACGATGGLLIAQHIEVEASPPPARAALQTAVRLRRLANDAHKWAVAMSPACARAWNGVGVTALTVPVAQHAFIRAVQLQGGGIALVNLAGLCIQSGYLALSAQVLGQAQNKDPNNTAMWLEHGMIGEAALRLEAAMHDNMSAAAFLSATDLSLHPAAMLPAVFHLMHGTGSLFQWNVDAAVRLANAESELAFYGRMVAEKDSTNPLALLASARVVAIRAALATYAVSMVCTGIAVFPASIEDLDVLFAYTLPYAHLVSGTSSQSGTRIPHIRRFATEMVRKSWLEMELTYERLAADLAAMLVNYTSDPGHVFGDANPFTAAMTECRIGAAYAAVMQTVAGKDPSAWHKALDIAASAIGVVRDAAGDVSDWKVDLHPRVLQAVSVRVPFTQEADTLAAFCIYACAASAGGESELAAHLLYELYSSSGVKPRILLVGLSRLIGVLPKAAALTEETPQSLMRTAIALSPAPSACFVHEIEIAGFLSDNTWQSTAASTFVTANPRMSFTAAGHVAWAERAAWMMF
jgi:tetratricopeptide (TPR) repeat protein